MTTTFSDARLELASYLRYAGIQALVKKEFTIEARANLSPTDQCDGRFFCPGD